MAKAMVLSINGSGFITGNSKGPIVSRYKPELVAPNHAIYRFMNGTYYRSL
jgi:hypothetical protein